MAETKRYLVKVIAMASFSSFFYKAIQRTICTDHLLDLCTILFPVDSGDWLWDICGVLNIRIKERQEGRGD